METKHTKGEWEVANQSEQKKWFNISSPSGIIARSFYGELEPIVYDYEAKANAKLIAASPYLLEALIKINGLIADASNVENGKVNLGELAKISITAIKKATE
jgi:hypothetical protein